MADTVEYVRSVEDLIISALGQLGLPNCGRLQKYPGVWVDPNKRDARKIAAVGVRLTRGRTMHGFALNVKPDMSYFDAIVPCGIKDKSVTSLSEEGLEISMLEVVNTVSELATERWGSGQARRMDVSWRTTQNELSPFSRGKGPGGIPKVNQSIEELDPNKRTVTIGRKSAR